MVHIDLLLDGLRDLADKDWQERVWSGRSHVEMSSFAELVCQVFDDTGLSSASDETRVRELGSEIAHLVRDLERALSRVDATLPVPDLIDSPSMEKVRKISAALVNLLATRR